MKALIYGSGAQGRVVLDILRAQAEHQLVGFIDDDPQKWGQCLNGCPVVGSLDSVLRREQATLGVVVALGNPYTRLKLADRLKSLGMELLNAVHPSAVTVPSAEIGRGNMIGALVVINSNARVGDNLIINNAAVIEHDSVLGDGVCISSGVQVGGRVTVERAAFIGTGAIILPRVSIGVSAVIGAGAVVTREVPAGVLALGVPARVVGRVDETFDWKSLF